MRAFVIVGLVLITAAASLALVRERGPAGAAFPGANGKIAFTSDRDGNSEIYVMNADGSGQTRLTNNPASDSDPVWSPDGSRIAFTSGRDGNSEIYVMNADGSGQTNLTNDPAIDSTPAWSPDGSRIAFTSFRDPNNGDVYVMNADGSGQTRLSNHFGLATDAAWSPDGTRIALTAVNTPRTSGIFTIKADGSNFRPLVALPDPISTQQPAWSPDGSRVAYVLSARPFVGLPAMPPAIFVIESSIIGPPNGVSLTTDAAADIRPAWSPDGSRITFSSDRDGNGEIYVMNADGSAQTNLTNNSANDEDPDWQPLPTAAPAPAPSPPAVCPAGSECVALVAGCQIVTSTEDLDAATLRDRFEPNYNSAWLLDAASGRWQGDSPAAAPALQGPNDLPGVDRLEGFFACMPEGGGTFERAIV